MQCQINNCVDRLVGFDTLESIAEGLGCKVKIVGGATE